MQFKSVTAIIVLSLVVASLLVAGCTTSTTSNTNQTPSAATQHNAILESVVSIQKAIMYSGSTTGENKTTVNAWLVTWLNDSSVNVQSALSVKNMTISSNDTMTAFPTTDAATAYLKTLDLSEYRIVSMDYHNQNDPLVLGSFR
jgi:hypothetical protein